MNPTELLRVADTLATGSGRRGRPSDAALRRAVSTAYYAMFHTLARNCASLLGGNRDTRQAWRQLYRALDHGAARNRCTSRPDVLERFPQGIQGFATQFAQMQERRHRADYDPFEQLSRGVAVQYIQQARAAIMDFNNSPRPDRRAFAVYVLFALRRDQ